MSIFYKAGFLVTVIGFCHKAASFCFVGRSGRDWWVASLVSHTSV